MSDERYFRQTILPGFGPEGQAKLGRAKVLIVGAGGLGCPALLYLAAAGVGTIGIIDPDTVHISNLHRQILYHPELEGQSKAEAASRKLTEFNPKINICSYPFALNRENALEIIEKYDIVADGTDNFATRYLVNDACVILDKPNVFASVYQYEGQVTVFNYRNPKTNVNSPHYRDLFPEPAPDALNCAEAGVLGVLTGIIGSMQAQEVIKIITGIGEPLAGKLLSYNSLTSRSIILSYESDPEGIPISELAADYEQFCGIVPEIEVSEMISWRKTGKNFQLIDVRTEEEHREYSLGGLLIPSEELEGKTAMIEKNIPVVIHCKAGGRSKQAIRLLQRKYGFTNLYSLKGGADEYRKREYS